MGKYGNTLLMLFFIVIFVLGVQMTLKIANPYIRPLSASLADAIQSA